MTSQTAKRLNSPARAMSPGPRSRTPNSGPLIHVLSTVASCLIPSRVTWKVCRSLEVAATLGDGGAQNSDSARVVADGDRAGAGPSRRLGALGGAPPLERPDAKGGAQPDVRPEDPHHPDQGGLPLAL